MQTTTHSVAKYTVQVLTQHLGKNSSTSIIVRLYDDDDNLCGDACFANYGDDLPAPHGDPDTGTATNYLDNSFYPAFMDILRLERPVYWKIHWIQTGAVKSVSDVSLDTKKEIIGDYFKKGR